MGVGAEIKESGRERGISAHFPCLTQTAEGPPRGLWLLFTCGGAVRSMDCTQNFGSGTLVIGRVGLIVSFEELDTVNVKSRIQ